MLTGLNGAYDSSKWVGARGSSIHFCGLWTLPLDFGGLQNCGLSDLLAL